MLNPKAVYELVKNLEEGKILELCNSRGHYLVAREGMGIEVRNPDKSLAGVKDTLETLNSLITKPKLFNEYIGENTIQQACKRWKYFWRKDRKAFPLPCTLDEHGNFSDATDNSLNGLTMSLEDIEATDWIGSDTLEDFQ